MFVFNCLQATCDICSRIIAVSILWMKIMLRRENVDIQGCDISQTQSRALINYSSQLTSDFTPSDDCP